MDPNGFQPFKLAYYISGITFLSDIGLYPIDTIATRAKSNSHKDIKFIQELRKVIKSEGLKSLYRGVSTSFSTTFMPTMVYLMLYENLNMTGKKIFEKRNWQKNMYLLPTFTAPISRLISIFTYIPFDIIRTRLQINSKEYRYSSIYQGLKQIQQQEGFIRLFKASYLYVIQAVMYVTIQFQTYEALRFFLIKSQENKNKLTFQEMLQITIVVQTVTSIMLNPIDVIITRYQINDESKNKINARNIIQKEGASAFFKKGLSSRFITNILSGLMWLPAYDYFKTQYGVSLN